MADGTGEGFLVRLVGSVGTLFGRYCGGCSFHECHTINSDFFSGAVAALSRHASVWHTIVPFVHSVSVFRVLGAVPDSLEWPLVCSVLCAWNVTPAHLPWLCASLRQPVRRGVGQSDTSHVKQTQPYHSHNGGNTTPAVLCSWMPPASVRCGNADWPKHGLASSCYEFKATRL